MPQTRQKGLAEVMDEAHGSPFRVPPGQDLWILLLDEETRMARVLKLLFRRDPSRNRLCNNIKMEGFQMMWPDGQSVGFGLDAFCFHAQRVLGLERYLKGLSERMLELVVFPLASPEAEFTRMPGLRVRRFMIQRQGAQGRIHLVNGMPTEIIFEDGRDEPRVLEWIGLASLREGEQAWFDFTPRPLAEASPCMADAPLYLPALEG